MWNMGQLPPARPLLGAELETQACAVTWMGWRSTNWATVAGLHMFLFWKVTRFFVR